MEQITDAIVQISTSECIGKGLVLSQHGIIVTSQHLVYGTPEVVVYSKHSKPVLAQVIYTDEIYDLAFIEMPKGYNIKPVSFSEHIQNEQKVFTYTDDVQSGKLLNIAHVFQQIDYLEIDIPLKTDYSGSPLIDDSNKVIGLIGGLLQSSNTNTSFALPSVHILKAISDFKKANSNSATRCRNCKTIVVPNTVGAGNLCASCGGDVELPHQAKSYEAEGVSRTIEELIDSLGHEPVLTRRGPYQWGLIQGSATIYLSYYEPRGYIMGDAFLCQLPKGAQEVDKIYEFLLRQNYITKGLTFSISQKDIVLSLIIYDRHLNTDTAKELLQNLLERADYYDNVLVEEYGATWKNNL